MNHYEGWIYLLGFPTETPSVIVFGVSSIFFLSFVLLPLALLLNFIERKMTADLQARVGPNRIGASGFFQGLSDAIKMLSKAPHVKENRNEKIWISLQNAALYSTLAALPLGTNLIFVHTELNSLLPFVSFAFYFLFISMMGAESKNIDELLSSLRGAFQFISGLIPALICLMVTATWVGSLSWIEIARTQNGGPLAWIIFSNPFGFVTSIVFILSGLLIFQSPPFHQLDLGLGHRSARRLALFRFNRFFSIFIWCIFSAVLFFGAWDHLGVESEGFFGSAVELFSVLLKSSLIYVLVKVVSKAMPQLRADQMTDFSWKVLTPASLLCLLGMSIWTAVIKT